MKIYLLFFIIIICSSLYPNNFASNKLSIEKEYKINKKSNVYTKYHEKKPEQNNFIKPEQNNLIKNVSLIISDIINNNEYDNGIKKIDKGLDNSEKNIANKKINNSINNNEYNIIKNSNIPKKTTIFDLISHKNKMPYIIYAINNYLKNNGNINATNEAGNTLLMEAVKIGYYDLADFLIENKSDISITNNEGKNALILSANYPYILNLLINNNADINFTDNNGKTVLHYAFSYGDLYSVKLLIKNGADINKKDILGKTMLMYAVENEHLELIKYLVEELNADINEKDEWGQNAMFFATKIDIARYLIYNNINYQEVNSIGLKPYEVMKYNGYINVANYLQKLEKRL